MNLQDHESMNPIHGSEAQAKLVGSGMVLAMGTIVTRAVSLEVTNYTEQNFTLVTFHYNGWLIGILIMAYLHYLVEFYGKCK